MPLAFDFFNSTPGLLDHRLLWAVTSHSSCAPQQTPQPKVGMPAQGHE